MGSKPVCAEQTIRINKPTRLRVIIPAVEIIQSALYIVVISPVSERVVYSKLKNIAIFKANFRNSCSQYIRKDD